MMAAKQDVFHLRLISNQEKSDEPANMYSEPPEQFSLAYPDRLAFIFAFVTTMTRHDFVELITKNMPSWVIDVRVAPRFDILACSREAAFRLFQEQNAIYVDLFGRLKVKSYRSAASNPAIWGEGLCNLLIESEREGPYMLLFDDHTLMVSAGNVLPPMIRGALGKKVHFRKIIASPEEERNLSAVK